MPHALLARSGLAALCTLLVPALVAGQTSSSTGSTPTWTEDVGPILAQNCMNCHRPSQVAPMSLLTYEEARDWSPLIKIMVEQRIMPPWHADPRYGHFGNDRRLTDEEIETIARWVDAGAPRGEGDFEAPDFAEGWLYAGVAGRPPDYVFEFDDPFEIPATGPDVYADVEVQTTHTEDIWVQAVEVRGNSRVVHHSGVNVIRPDGTRDPTGRLAAYTPGKQWDRFPEGSAKLIPVGSKLVFGMHYNTTGEAEEDVHRVGVWLAEAPIEYTIYSTVAADGALEIPPFEPNYESRAEFVFRQDSEITLMKPHMHWRGKDMLYRVVYQDGTADTLLSVPRYDMGWQISYELQEPFPVPAGAKLEVISHFDNSADNPRNPDPSVKVVWGQESRDEMMEGWFDYRVRRDEPIVPQHTLPVRNGESPERAPSRVTGELERQGGSLVAAPPLPSPTPTAASLDPAGIWNLRTELLADRPTRGVRNAILRVERTNGTLGGRITAIDNRFLDVQNFRWESGVLEFEFGAYAYTLALQGDELVGIVRSPAGTQQVVGSRQDDMLFVGEPEPFYSTRQGTIALRDGSAPPEGEPDPGAWIRARVDSPDDYGLLIRNGVVIPLTNPEEFAEELAHFAGQRVDFTGTWVGDSLRIEGIAAQGTTGH